MMHMPARTLSALAFQFNQRVVGIVGTKMKMVLKISLLLNLTLLGGFIFLLTHKQHKEAALPAAPSEPKPPALAAASAPPTPSGTNQEPLRWSQLTAANDYRAYIANLRAVGCPEPTIEDIVRGDADRAFSWERHQLHMDGSGAGPWSRAREMQLVASLLGAQSPEETETLAQNVEPSQSADQGVEVAQTSVPSPNTTAESPSYPLFLQNVNWKALGFTADQQAAIAQVRQQFQAEVNNLNQNAGGSGSGNSDSVSQSDGAGNPVSNDSTALSQWQSALQSAEDQLRGQLGAPGWMAYEQQQYDAWYQAQVAAANGGHLTLDLANFSLK